MLTRTKELFVVGNRVHFPAVHQVAGRNIRFRHGRLKQQGIIIDAESCCTSRAPDNDAEWPPHYSPLWAGDNFHMMMNLRHKTNHRHKHREFFVKIVQFHTVFPGNKTLYGKLKRNFLQELRIRVMIGRKRCIPVDFFSIDLQKEIRQTAGLFFFFRAF